jgi:hypothetical protein
MAIVPLYMPAEGILRPISAPTEVTCVRVALNSQPQCGGS